MAVKGYTTAYMVSHAIGKDDGVPPVATLDVLIEAAEEWIDSYTNRSWLVTSVTNEQHTLNTWPPTTYAHFRTWGANDWWDRSYSNRRDAVVTLNVVPVTAITAVRARALYVGAPVTTLPATDYELVDATLGQLLVTASWYGKRLSVDYTPNTPLPADVKLAATLLVVSWVQPMLNSGLSISAGIKSYQIGQDLQVTFQDRATNLKLAAPPEVINILDGYTSVVFGF